MLAVTDDALYTLARSLAANAEAFDKKQLRFNDIVETAKRFYNDPAEGVIELTDSCRPDSPLYIKKQPMWQTLNTQYSWMLPKWT